MTSAVMASAGLGVIDAVARAKVLGVNEIIVPSGTWDIDETIVLDADFLTLRLAGATIRTTGDFSIVRLGAPASSATSVSNASIVGFGTLQGGGTGKTANHGIVLRNASYCEVGGSIKVTNCGGKALAVEAYQRGVQYNRFSGITGTGNFGGALTLDTLSGAGGYINDNHLAGCRFYENNDAADDIVQWEIKGSGPIHGNCFHTVSAESLNDSHTCLKITGADCAENVFLVRLDGTNSTKALDIAAEAGIAGNIFTVMGWQGTVSDLSGKNFYQGERGASNLPFINIGGWSTGGFQFAILIPNSRQELTVGPGSGKAGDVRFPTGDTGAPATYFFGDHNADRLQILPAQKRMRFLHLTGDSYGATKVIFEDFTGGSAPDGVISQDAQGLKLGAKPLLDGGFRVNNSADVGSLGAATKRIEVFNADGTSLGFLQVYPAA